MSKCCKWNMHAFALTSCRHSSLCEQAAWLHGSAWVRRAAWKQVSSSEEAAVASCDGGPRPAIFSGRRRLLAALLELALENDAVVAALPRPHRQTKLGGGDDC